MNRINLIILLTLCFCSAQITAQINNNYQDQLDEFVITHKEFVNNEIFVSACKDPELGVIVFYTAIKDIEFDIHNLPDRLINKYYDSKNNRYILCVRPTKGRKYQISIKHKNFQGEIWLVENINPSQACYFNIESKRDALALKLEEEERKRREAELARVRAEGSLEKIGQKYNDNNLALGIGNGITCGNIGAYARFRFGGIVGAGIEGGVGLSDFDNKLMHWSAGVKFYPYKYWALSAHYGTVSVEKIDSFNSETGEFGIGGVKHDKGWSVLGGYDGFVYKNIHVNAGVGFSYTDRISFAWNIGIGFSLTGILLKL